MAEADVFDALIKAAEEVAAGNYFEAFRVPSVSGGAGTSINMNINEIIANVALKSLGLMPGNYQKIDPVEQANIFQSTNDVIPTALRVATMILLGELETEINQLRFAVESIEKNHHAHLRPGYTQMQEAVPSSFGKLFSTYNDALSRDWWRVSKCFERIKVVNLGGGAIGTGMAIPRFFIMEVVSNLQKITGLPVSRSENIADTTSNLDSIVEVHAILKSHAVNLEKMVSDLRLLASDIVTPLIALPQVQVGSSIMPAKVNPVIPEFVISAAHKVYANDGLVASLAAQGCLELNAYLPVIGHALLESVKLLISCNITLRKNLFLSMIIHPEAGTENLMKSPSVTTALIPVIGYHQASLLAKRMREEHCDIFTANNNLQMIGEEKLRQLLNPENLLKLGFVLSDLD
jgi:aspartate ammonia-lyase